MKLKKDSLSKKTYKEASRYFVNVIFSKINQNI